MLCVTFYSFYSLWCLLDGGRGDIYMCIENLYVCNAFFLLLVNSFRENEIVSVVCVPFLMA